MIDSAVVVLGTGSVGYRHLSVLRSLGRKCIAVPVRPDRARTLSAEGWEVAGSLDESASMGARAAVIATDTHRHVPDTQHALRLGLDVLCEKPLAEDAVAASRLPGLPEESRPRLFVAYCLRFDEGLSAFCARLGSIGKIHSVRIECRSFLPEWQPHRDYRESYSARALEGGVLRDMSHEVDYACWLFGIPGAVSGTIGNTGRLGIESEEIRGSVLGGSWRRLRFHGPGLPEQSPLPLRSGTWKSRRDRIRLPLPAPGHAGDEWP